MTAVKQALGRWGEDLAVQFLEKSGYEVLARNWRCRDGELDVVVRRDGTLCFVEVKTRSSAAFGLPAEAVGPQKAARIRKLAGRWLTEQRPRGWSGLRFDVVSVMRTAAGPEVLHLEDVF